MKKKEVSKAKWHAFALLFYAYMLKNDTVFVQLLSVIILLLKDHFYITSNKIHCKKISNLENFIPLNLLNVISETSAKSISFFKCLIQVFHKFLR